MRMITHLRWYWCTMVVGWGQTNRSAPVQQGYRRQGPTIKRTRTKMKSSLLVNLGEPQETKNLEATCWAKVFQISTTKATSALSGLCATTKLASTANLPSLKPLYQPSHLPVRGRLVKSYMTYYRLLKSN